MIGWRVARNAGSRAGSRLIATADMTAGAAEPQMKPGIAGLEAVLAAQAPRRHVAYCRQMSAALDIVGSPNCVRDGGRGEWARKLWIAATTCAPSPDRPAFTEPDRTSPTANAPGMEDSSADGAGRRRSRPGHPRSLPYPAPRRNLSRFGRPPRERTERRCGIRHLNSAGAPVAPANLLEAGAGGGARATVSVISSIFEVAAMRSIRYCDMLSARPGPRTIHPHSGSMSGETPRPGRQIAVASAKPRPRSATPSTRPRGPRNGRCRQ